MVVSFAPVHGGVRLGRLVAWVTRVVAVGAVATQSTLLGIELKWAARDHAPLGAVLGHQGELLAVTLALTAAAFWLTAQIRPSDPLARLRLSTALRLAAIRADDPAPTRGV
jgi:hypothetical protein